MLLLARWRTSTSALAGRLPALLRASAYPLCAPAGWLFKHHGGRTYYSLQIRRPLVRIGSVNKRADTDLEKRGGQQPPAAPSTPAPNTGGAPNRPSPKPPKK